MSIPETLEKIRKKYPSRLTRGRAIKLYCKENCCAGDTTSWRECSQKACFLWSFRLGKEILGNSTSFTKKTGKLAVLKRKEASEKGDEEVKDEL